MQERLENRTRLIGPVAIHIRGESLPGSRCDYLHEPGVEASALVVLDPDVGDWLVCGWQAGASRKDERQLV